LLCKNPCPEGTQNPSTCRRYFKIKYFHIILFLLRVSLMGSVLTD
jgi:hypothetical protein